jgi:hypothetical protein
MNTTRKKSGWPTPLVLGCAILCFGIGFITSHRISPAVVPQLNQSVMPPAREEIVEIPAITPIAPSWDARWREQKSRTICPATTRKRAALLEELARTDPKRALELALAESNLLVRDELRAAALRGWAAVAPDAAGEWALAQPTLGERMRCFDAVLAGAVENPAEAVRIALKACESDPEPARNYGHTLVNALIERAGDFKTAVEFAQKVTAVEGQSYLIDSAYFQWAQNEPERAFTEVAALADPEIQDAAMKGLIQGFANSDASVLADYAKALPEGEDRSRILAVALPEWMGKDPQAALDWINQADPHPDFDFGLGTLATSPAMAQSHPLIALELTDGMCDSVQRGMAKGNVFLQWARHDFGAAERYAQSVQNPEYREMFSGILETVAYGMNE